MDEPITLFASHSTKEQRARFSYLRREKQITTKKKKKKIPVAPEAATSTSFKGIPKTCPAISGIDNGSFRLLSRE